MGFCSVLIIWERVTKVVLVVGRAVSVGAKTLRYSDSNAPISSRPLFTASKPLPRWSCSGVEPFKRLAVLLNGISIFLY